MAWRRGSLLFFFSGRRRHTRSKRDWSSDVCSSDLPAILWSLFAGALLLGAMFVLPIGGGDMPVVISILNSLTGLAAALTGFVLHNQMLVVEIGRASCRERVWIAELPVLELSRAVAC